MAPPGECAVLHIFVPDSSAPLEFKAGRNGVWSWHCWGSSAFCSQGHALTLELSRVLGQAYSWFTQDAMQCM